MPDDTPDNLVDFAVPVPARPTLITTRCDRRPVGLGRYQGRRLRSLDRRIFRSGYAHIPN